MMIIVKLDDVSYFELEEMGDGNLRAMFKDGITKAEAQAFVKLKEFSNIGRLMYECQQMAEAFRQGTPRSSAPNQRLLPH